MLVALFMKIVDMTLAASFVIGAVLLARLFLRKAPKNFSYVLWAVVLFRLLCPVSLELPISMVPEVKPVEESYTLTEVPISPVGAGVAAYQAVGDVFNGGLGIQQIPTELSDSEGGVQYVQSHWWEVWVLFGQYVWVVGLFGMGMYSLISYVRLRRKLVVVSPLRDNIYLADDIPSPFVMGLLKPKIYLPSSMEEKEQAYIILHEQHHIRRGDPIWKTLGFFALCIHWFNPLVWIAFVMASKDMEMSCDEAVVRKMGEEVLPDYSASLLSLATGKKRIAGMPLAFGEGDPKGRIRNLAHWKKPAFWVIVVAVASCITLAVCLLGNPSDKEIPEPIANGQYAVTKVIYESGIYSFSVVAGENAPFYRLTEDMELASAGEHGTEGEWITLGIMEEVKLDKENFDQLFFGDEDLGWLTGKSARSIRKNTVKAWQLVYDQSILYYLIQQKSGDLFLAYGYYDDSEKDDPYSDDTSIRWVFQLTPDDKGTTYTGQPVCWSFLPMASATWYSFFQFHFDLDVEYTHVEATCDHGELHNQDMKYGKDLRFESGEPIRWRPEFVDSLLNTTERAEIAFVVYQGKEIVCSGKLNLSRADSQFSQSTSVYEAILNSQNMLILNQELHNQGATITSKKGSPITDNGE